MIKKGDRIINALTGQEMHFLITAKESQGKILRIECLSPQSSIIEPEHIHPQQINRFEILEGEINIMVNGRTRTASAGDIVEIPKAVPHYFWNSSSRNVKYIQEFEPALKIADFFELYFYLANNNKLNKKASPPILHASVIMLHFKNEIRITNPPWIFQLIGYILFSPIGKLFGYKAQIGMK